MEKVFVFLFVILFAFSMTFVQAGFGDINTDDETTDDEDDTSEETETSSTDDSLPTGSRDKGVAVTKYTKELYIALGLGALGLLIVFYIIYRIVMGPKVRWRKPKPVKL